MDKYFFLYQSLQGMYDLQRVHGLQGNAGQPVLDSSLPMPGMRLGLRQALASG